jgi:hypothetical protein
MSALVHASELLAIANAKGRKLTSAERRHCIQFLQATQPDMLRVEMAHLFDVSERQISLDKAWIREQKARFLRDEISKDMSLVIADIAMDFEKQVGDIEKSKRHAKFGTKAYVDHCTSIFRMRLEMIQAFQDIGYLPKNLGAMTVEKFEYKATVSRDGAVNTRAVDMFDDKPDNDPTKRAALDAEFTDVPALPAPQEEVKESEVPNTGASS